jgi:hypothetical protein
MFKNLCSDAYIDCVQFQAEQEARRMDARQLATEVAELLPPPKRVQVDSTTVVDDAGLQSHTVDLMVDAFGHEAWIHVKTCEQALAAFKANVEQLRFGDVSVKVGA